MLGVDVCSFSKMVPFQESHEFLHFRGGGRYIDECISPSFSPQDPLGYPNRMVLSINGSSKAYTSTG